MEGPERHGLPAAASMNDFYHAILKVKPADIAFRCAELSPRGQPRP
jgi:hypothetical protein